MTSTIKVNTIQNTCGADIIKESSNTITLGASGDTVTLASGASQTGFGRTGTVDWQTTKKTTAFTAVNGEGYFVDTAASGAVTMTLPSSPSAGNIVAVKDYNGNFASAALTIGRNGSPINGGNAGDVIITTDGASIVLVYVDASQGWVATQDDSSIFTGQSFVNATGGTITTCGNCRIHTFTGPGTFAVLSVSDCAANNLVSYVVVAGAGSGGGRYGGGGGAGGYRETKSPVTPFTASPLDGYSTPGNRITVTAGPTSYPITVGGGGAQPATDTPGSTCGSAAGTQGSNSVFSTITSAGGGGGSGQGNGGSFTNGGSGGGADYTPGNQGTGNTPPVTPPQGNSGGNNTTGGSSPYTTGGGGGASAAGSNSSSSRPGAGGGGQTSSITGTGIARSGGGGGGGSTHASPGAGSPGGAGGGATGGSVAGARADAGTVNTGGGGGGGFGNPGMGGAGGSGIVIIRYKFK